MTHRSRLRDDLDSGRHDGFTEARLRDMIADAEDPRDLTFEEAIEQRIDGSVQVELAGFGERGHALVYVALGLLLIGIGMGVAAFVILVIQAASGA